MCLHGFINGSEEKFLSKSIFFVFTMKNLLKSEEVLATFKIFKVKKRGVGF